MQRVYRQKPKMWTGVFRGGILLAVLIAAACLWTVSPEDVLRSLAALTAERSQPSIIQFAVHMKTPRRSLLERLISPQLVSYSFETALEEGTITENAEGTLETSGTAAAETGTDDSIFLSVEPEYQAELLQENIYGQEEDEVFSPVRQQILNPADFDSFEALIEEFYVVDSSTQATASLINLESLTSYDCTISREDPAPQILIYHSHSQETYIDSDENDPSTTIVGVGEHLTQLLESYGYSVLHHEGTYDVPSRDDAYSKALPAIEELLEEYPSIEVVIDLHRDAVAEGTKLVYTYEGKDYARFMFFNGISRTASGPIDYLYNENLSANLAFSFQAQLIAESYFPGITRGIYLKAWRYNMHLMPKYMLIELGAQTNTVEEAMNTCEILAFVLDQVLSGGD